MQLSTISPAPSATASTAQAIVSRPASSVASGRPVNCLTRQSPLGAAQAVDAEHDALAAEGGGEFGDEVGAGERGGIDADLVGARGEAARGGLDVADPARDREGNVDHRRHAPHPIEVDAAAVGAGGDVVEDKLVGARVAIAQRMVDDVANVAVIAELDALDDAAVGDVEAGDDPSRGHARPPRRR